MKLYELTDQYDEVINLLYDGETDEQTILDTLESIEGEIEDKADNYARIIKNLSAEAEMVKAEADWLYNLPAWDSLLTKERRKELFLEQKKSGTVVKGRKIGRNEPCPCGSGKKYKFCCGKA